MQGWIETLSKGIFYLKLEFELKMFFLSYKRRSNTEAYWESSQKSKWDLQSIQELSVVSPFWVLIICYEIAVIKFPIGKPKTKTDKLKNTQS